MASNELAEAFQKILKATRMPLRTCILCGHRVGMHYEFCAVKVLGDFVEESVRSEGAEPETEDRNTWVGAKVRELATELRTTPQALLTRNQIEAAADYLDAIADEQATRLADRTVGGEAFDVITFDRREDPNVDAEVEAARSRLRDRPTVGETEDDFPPARVFFVADELERIRKACLGHSPVPKTEDGEVFDAKSQWDGVMLDAIEIIRRLRSAVGPSKGDVCAVVRRALSIPPQGEEDVAMALSAGVGALLARGYHGAGPGDRHYARLLEEHRGLLLAALRKPTPAERALLAREGSE